MITEKQLDAIEVAAKSWEGAAFCEGSPLKGVATACQHLIAEIDFEADILPRMEIPNGPPGWAQVQDHSLIAEWLDSSPFFERVSFDKARPFETLQAGDHLGFRVGQTIHHLGLLLRDGKMVHAVRDRGVQIALCIPTPWLKRLEAIWRLK